VKWLDDLIVVNDIYIFQMRMWVWGLILTAHWVGCKTHTGTPITVVPWQGKARIQGAYVLTPITIILKDRLCEDLPSQIKVTNKAVRLLNNIQLDPSDRGVIKQLTYLVLQIELTYTEIIRYVTTLSLCPHEIMSKIRSNFSSLREALNVGWNGMSSIEHKIAPALVAHRPIIPQYQVAQFPSILLGIGAGIIGGTLIGSLFGSSDHTEEIKVINQNLHKTNKNILITNTRLDVLAQNVSIAMGNIKTILEGIQDVTNQRERKHNLYWNLDQVLRVATNTNILFKLVETTITLLREGILNAELIHLPTLQKVVKEGLNIFGDLEFPIHEISKGTLTEIVKLIRIDNLGQGNFIAIIPLVRKTHYKPYSLIPVPVQINSGSFMIADTKDIILEGADDYILTEKNNIIKIGNMTYMLNQIHPVWSKRKSTCEWEGLQQNTGEVFKLCEFRKFGTDTGIHLTETEHNRILYVSEETMVHLNCPDGRIRAPLIGLHTVSPQCDIETEDLKWPAQQTKEINIKTILAEKPHPYDITTLPILTINDTNPIHESIRKLIQKLPENKSFTFDFDGYNLSMEEVQSYTIIANVGITILTFINLILIVLLYFRYIKNMNKRKINEEESGLELGLRESFRKQIRETFPLDRIQNKLRNSSARNSIRKKLKSSRDRLRNTRDSIRKLAKHRALEPMTRNVGTNTQIISPVAEVRTVITPTAVEIKPSAPPLSRYK